MKKAPYTFTLAIAAFLSSCNAEKQAVANQEKFAKDFSQGMEAGIAANTKDYFNECFAEDFARGFNDGIKANSKDYYNECFAEDLGRGLSEGLKAGEEKKKSE